MIFTVKDEIYHKADKICHICNRQCINKVRDHCHRTSKHRGPAC